MTKPIMKVICMNKEYITLMELAQCLKISRATIDRWRKEGMPSYKIGNGVRFIESEVSEWIEQHKSKQQSLCYWCCHWKVSRYSSILLFGNKMRTTFR